MGAREQTLETIVGAAVLAAAGGFLFFAFTSAREASASSGYSVNANFESVQGISVGSDVRVAGVKVGAVSNITLDPDTYQAKVRLMLEPSVKIPSDSVAKISSDGLLGGAYLSVVPGGETVMLKNGGQFENTRGSVDLMTLLMQFATSKPKDDDASAAATDAPPK